MNLDLKNLDLNAVLMKLPLASSAFLAYAVVGTIMLLSGTLEYGAFSTNLLAIGIACGAIGVPRAVSKVAAGTESVNLFGFIESIDIPTVVFVIFLIASSVSLALGIISYGEFSDNIWKVGIACGAVHVARTAEHVVLPPELIDSEPLAPTPPPPGPPDPPQPPADRPVA